MDILRHASNLVGLSIFLAAASGIALAQQKELVLQVGHAGPVNAIAFSPDGRILASASDDQTVKLWDSSTGAEVRTLKGHRSAVRSVAFISGGEVLASGEQYEVKFWNVRTGAELSPLKIDSDATSLRFSPDERLLAVGDRNFRYLWDIVARRRIRVLHPQWETDWCGFADNDRKFFCVSRAVNRLRRVTLLDVASNTSRSEEAGPAEDVTAVLRRLGVASPDDPSARAPYDGRLRVTQKTVEVLDPATGARLHAVSGGFSDFGSFTLSRNGASLAAVDRKQGVAIWDVPAGRRMPALKSKPEHAEAVAFADGGKTLLARAAGVLNSWDVFRGDRKGSVDCGEGKYFRFSPDGKLIARATQTSDVRGSIEVLDTSSCSPLWEFDFAEWGVYPDDAVFSPDGKLLAGVGHLGSNKPELRVWDIATGRLRHSLRGVARGDGVRHYVAAVAFSPDGRYLFESGSEPALWDLATGAKVLTVPADGSGSGVKVLSPDGKLSASARPGERFEVRDGSTGKELYTFDFSPRQDYSPDGRLVLVRTATEVIFREARTGKEVGRLFSLGGGEWAVITPEGLFDGSPHALRMLFWRFNGETLNYVPVEAFFNEYYYPGLLGALFSGAPPDVPREVSRRDRRLPQVKLELAGRPAAAGAPPREVTVRVVVTRAPAGARDVRLFRNGSLVKAWRGDVLGGRPLATLEATLPVVAGENELIAYAFNDDNVKSTDAALVVAGDDALKRGGTVHILAAGINLYANEQFNLSYAVADADSFHREVRRWQERLKNYDRVESTVLFDRDATKANILRALADIGARAQPEDAVVIYFAGHGLAAGERFYLVPHDLGYAGGRGNLTQAGVETILARSISDRELELSFEAIDAGQLLLVIDACHSGQALEAEERRRGPMNSKGLAQLAYEKGMYVLTAAQSYQAALEASQLGHGLLTFALIEEGLKRGQADREPEDGVIQAREWLDYAMARVPEMQIEETKRALGRGIDLAFADEEWGLELKVRSGQRPRVFYRREPEARPFIVAWGN